MKLREYQSKAVRDLRRLVKKHGRVVAVAPTGSGKTVIGAALVRAMRGKRILWLAHRFELLRQARDKIIACGVPKVEVGILSGPEKANTKARILVASIDMFRDLPVPPVDLFVVDEAHHVNAQSYLDILDARRDADVLGLTATPERLDGAPLGDVFAHLYTVAEAVELVADGHLLHPVVYGIPREKACELVKGASGGGKDYSLGKLAANLRKRPLMADIVQEKQRLAPGEPTIVYAVNREHGRDLCRRFKRAGMVTAYVDALTSDGERERLLGEDGALASGDVEVVVNVGVLTEGFDCPPVGCIVVARPTKSLTLWRQMCGRGARPHRRKKRFLVLDHAGNVWRHGFPDAPIEWSLEGRERSRGDAPVKVCAECGAMNHLSAKECAECGVEFPLSERELAERRAELERVRRREEELKAAEERVRRVAAEKGADEAWVQKVLATMAA